MNSDPITSDPVSEYAIADDGCRIWFHRNGHGDPLIWCHGGPGLWDYFGDLAEQLGDVAHSIRWDQRGAGRSDPHGPYSVARSVADLETVRAHSGAERVNLIGHSWGAHLALEYTLRHPERVSRLIYVSGTGIDAESSWRPSFRSNLHRGLGPDTPRSQELIRRERTDAEDRELAVLQWSAEFTDPATARAQAEQLATPWFGINHESNAAITAQLRAELPDPELTKRCGDLALPVLIVDGALDLRPRWAVDSLDAAVPQAQRATFAGAGHLPWADDPDGFQVVVRAFLGS
jgi:proline iminopeptidase